MTSHGAAVEVTDVEKHAYENKVEPVADHEGEVQTGSTQVLAKKLKSRHMQMIAIGKHSRALSNYLDRKLTKQQVVPLVQVSLSVPVALCAPVVQLLSSLVS